MPEPVHKSMPEKMTSLRTETRKSLFPFEYTILRSARRRSISIEIKSARVVVRAPLGVAESLLLNFLRQKSAWVQEKVAAQTQTLEQIPTYSYLAGSRLPWLGKETTLVLGTGASSRIVLHAQQLHIILS